MVPYADCLHESEYAGSGGWREERMMDVISTDRQTD